MNYCYPIDETWTTEEIVDVVNYFTMIEKAYEKGIKTQDLLLAYRRFKQIVPSKSEEKKLDKEFEKHSGYSAFQVIKKAREMDEGETIKLRK